MPGGTLPLRLLYVYQTQIVKTAMEASAPYKCLLVVVGHSLPPANTRQPVALKSEILLSNHVAMY